MLPHTALGTDQEARAPLLPKGVPSYARRAGATNEDPMAPRLTPHARRAHAVRDAWAGRDGLASENTK